MSRYKELKHIFEENQYFKIVCGAGNEDCEEVYKLSLVYTLAGALGIDVSANVEVVKSAASGIDKAFEVSAQLKKKLKIRPFINVSIGMRGDPHIRKAIINKDLCKSCGFCLKSCLQKAISKDYQVLEKRCIGCGECFCVCSFGAVSFFDKRKELKSILPDCLKFGAETFELHAIIADDNSVMEDWSMMNKILPNNYISMCLDRSQLSDTNLIKRIRAAYQITGERMIVQADGVSMSGAKDDYNTTLQAIAIADMIKKSKIPVVLLASGGTNGKTKELANLCGVEVNGVAVGTFARKLVYDYISKKDFENNLNLINKAVSAAQDLIRKNL